ncbi:hypothetical protein DL770_000307 [Monosporascus sp. CRB-9-2]|nr:hypothetical protein DL770_000307 [Monosporascus sp. CRB-9-2]
MTTHQNTLNWSHPAAIPPPYNHRLDPYGYYNITAYLPPVLQAYVQGAVSQLSDAFAGSTEFLEARGIPPTVLYSTLACAALALPYSMSWYGWGSSRDRMSPYASQTDSLGAVEVSDADYTYITSEDLLNEQPRTAPRIYGPEDRSPPLPADDEDDVLMIKHKGAAFPVLFPAYSIGDGKVFVQDVRDRIGLIMKLGSRRTRHIKMLYKGHHLKAQDKPIRDYGVKNNSELLIIIPEGRLSDEEDGEGGSSDSGSGEEVIVADTRDERKSRKPKKSKGRNKKKKKDRGTPHDSAAYLDVPDGDNDGGSSKRSPSADRSRHPSRIPSPAVPAGPWEKLDAISTHFETQLLPLCNDFVAQPPADPKKCEDEHRKLSETVLQHVLLKLDEVDTGGDSEIRARRKELVNRVQEVLKHLDEHLPKGVKPKHLF